jgi:predicted DNA-binding transcriptional regulator AlpA
MNPDESSPAQPASLTAPHRVTLSPYVNEQFPNWEELLSAHDVARLTRRPRWALLSLALIGRFPRKRRFHGRGIGWLRTDVIRWLAKDLRTTQCHSNSPAIARSRVARQGMLALEHSRSPHTVRKKPSACINSKRGSSDVEPCSPSPQTSSQVFAGSSRR